MIDYIDISDVTYPFMFSLRAIFSFMNASGLQSMNEAEQSIALDYDSLLSLYEQASKKGCKKDEEFDGKPLSAADIEDVIDEEPQLFMTLQKAFNESKAMKAFAGEEVQKADAKKK